MAGRDAKPVERVLVTGAGGPAGRAVCVLLLLRGLHVTGADHRPEPRPGIDVLPVPEPGDPGLADGVARAARRARADLVVPTLAAELGALCRDWPHIDAAPPALLPPVAAVAVVASPLAMARALRRFVAMAPPVRSPPGDYAVSLVVAGDDPRRDVVVVLRRSALVRADVGKGPGLLRVEAPDIASAARAAARAAGVRGPAEVRVRRRAGGATAVVGLVPCLGAASLHAPEVVDAVLAAVRVPGRRAAAA